MFKTIKLVDIFQDGIPCAIKDLKVETLGNVLLPCEYSQTEFTIQLDETTEAVNCITITIKCEDCNLCPPIIRQYCFCDNLLLKCPACHECIAGQCRDKCNGKPCKNGQCVDCVEGGCTGGKICTPDGCKCPSGSYEDSAGICRQCINSGHCKNCETCYGYVCTPKSCPGQVLNLLSCACEECTGKEHCGPNQYCEGGKCKCLPNYIWDPVARTCTPRPNCGPTMPCPDCYNCVAGECQLNGCPAGYVNSGIAGKCCVKECDCAAKLCAGMSSICVLYDINKCFCQTCEGNCDENNPCTGLGCACNFKTKKCEPNPCDRPCDPSNPCPAGCGCLNGRCTSCSFLTCSLLNMCNQAIGCNCDGANNCVTSPCTGTCFGNPLGCLGINCGCDQVTHNCVDCSKIPCGLNGLCPFGCGCDQNTGYCKKDPCDKPCETGADCGLGCGCDPVTKRCRSCSSYNCTNCLLVSGCDCINGAYCGGVPKPQCDESLKITKLGNCTIKGEVINATTCCPCTDIALETILTWTGTTILNLHANLRKGLLATSPKLGDNTNPNVADNELPTEGKLVYTVAVTAFEVHCVTHSGLIQVPPQVFETSAIAILAETDDIDLIFNDVAQPGTIFTRNGKCYKSSEVNVYVSTSENVKFVGRSECESSMVRQLVTKSLSTTFANGLNIFDQLVGCANPLLVWYKGATQALASLFRKAYAPNNIDIITEADDLEICKYYKLSRPSCGCAKDVWYNCGGTNLYVGTKLVFCQPVDLIIQSLDSCNNSIKILETLVCPAMKTAVYKLWINGIQEGASFSPDVNNKLFTGNLTVNKAYPIVEVKLTLDCDDCESCTITKKLTPSSDPCVCGTNDWVLSNSGSNCSNISILITGNTGAPAGTIYTFDSQFGTGNGVIGGGGTSVVNIGGPHVSGSYQITVTINGCKKVITVVLSGCCELNPGTYAYACDTKIISQPTAPTGNGVGPYTYQILLDVWTNFTIGAAMAAALAEGAYQIKVTDSITGCVEYALLIVTCANELSATAEPSCSGGDPACPGITIEVTSGNGPFSVYTALITGGPWTLRTNSLAINTPYSYNDCGLITGDTLYYKIVDSSAIPQELLGSITIGECEAWSALVSTYCNPSGGAGKISVLFNDEGDYRVLINPDPSDGLGSEIQFPTTGWMHKTAGSSELYDAVNETYDVTVEKQGGGKKSYPNKIVSCDSYILLHDCTLGLRIERNGSPYDCYIKIDNSPGAPLLLSTLGVFFVPGGLHTITLYDPSNAAVMLTQLSFSGINNCCALLTSSVICNGDGTGTIGFIWGSGHCGLGFHTVTLYDSLGATVGTSGENNGSFASLPNGVYRLSGQDTCSNHRFWQNGAILYCINESFVTVDCVDSCGLNTALLPISNDISACGGGGSCTTIVTNNHPFAVNYILESKPFDGTCNDPNVGIWSTITSGQIQPNASCMGSCTLMTPVCSGGCVCNDFAGACQGIFKYCTLGGSLCYRITITRPGNIDPACKIVKSFNCP